MQILFIAVTWQIFITSHGPFDLGLVGLAMFLPAVASSSSAGLCGLDPPRRAGGTAIPARRAVGRRGPGCGDPHASPRSNRYSRRRRTHWTRPSPERRRAYLPALRNADTLQQSGATA
jgi:hypothetical protein